MHEAKSQLSRLGRMAWAGEDVIIAKAGEPWLQLVPYRGMGEVRRPGALKGRIRLAEDFDETPSELIDAFYKSPTPPAEVL